MKKFSIFLSLASMLYGDIHLSSDEAYTQENSQRYCRDFGASWRPMMIEELYALPQSTPFKDGYSYWSSSRVASGDAITGTGSEGDGGVIATLGYSFYPKERNISLSPPTKKIAAACTNIPMSAKQWNLMLTKEGTADKQTGLFWHSLDATDKKTKFTYDGAIEMCTSLTLFGRAWRLPTTQELYSIVNTNFLRPSVDMHYFGPMMHRYYWSSDELNTLEAYVVGFKLGSVATVSKKEEAYVRCVSDE